MSIPKWGGSRARAWTRAVLREKGTVCALQLEGCTQLATEGDHIKARSTHLHLQYDVANGQPACRHCNAARGARPLRRPKTIDTRDWFA